MKFEKDVMRALSGADYVREKLLMLAATGPTPLVAQTYAVKCRVKSAESLSKKVESKRKGEDGDKSYTPMSATDIVGMRLLALYSEDLLELTSALLAFISFGQSADIKLFVGDALSDCIREAIVYKSHENPDIYDSVFDYLRRKNLGKNDKGNDKLSVGKFDDPKKKYSSIHLVCDAVSYSGETPKVIQVEFQIRSIFEDAWAEIDNNLRYKFDQKYPRVGKFAGEYLDASKDQLWTLKATLEQAGNQATNIRNAFNAVIGSIEHSKRRQPLSWKLPLQHRGDPYEKVVFEKFPDELRNDIERISKEIAQIRDRLEKPVDSNWDYRDIRGKIDKYNQLIGRTNEKLEKHHGDLFREEPSIAYFIGMEIAIGFVWMGILVRQFEPHRIRKYREYFEDAKRQYENLEKSVRDDCFLAYRLGLVHSLLDQGAEAEFYVKRAFKLLANEKELGASEHVVLIPKQYGFQLWKRRVGILKNGMKSNNPRLLRDDQLALLDGCLNLTKIAMNNLEKFMIDGFDKAEHRAALENNMISYLWEVYDLARSYGEYQRRVETYEPGMVEAWLEDLVADHTVVTELSRLDTLMKGFEVIGDTKNTKKFMAKVEKQVGMNENLHNDNNELYYYAVQRVRKRMEDPMPEV